MPSDERTYGRRDRDRLDMIDDTRHDLLRYERAVIAKFER